jgi:hypothetical protein
MLRLPSELKATTLLLVPTFADRWCYVVNVTDPYARIRGFLDRVKLKNTKKCLLSAWEHEQIRCLSCAFILNTHYKEQLILQVKHVSGFQQDHDCKSVGEMYNYTWVIYFFIVLKIQPEDRI